MLFCDDDKVTLYGAQIHPAGNYFDSEDKTVVLEENLLLLFSREKDRPISAGHSCWQEMLERAVPEIENWLRPHFAIPWGKNPL